MFHTAVAERLGLNATDHKALDLLSRAGSLTAGELASLTGLTTGAITGVIDRLEEAGYVQRVRDPRDRRKVHIQAVENHERLHALEQVFGAFYQAIIGVAEHYTDAELATITQFLEQTIDVLRAETTRLRQESEE
jgi:DNA-binding MarR family transcriptional regulator